MKDKPMDVAGAGGEGVAGTDTQHPLRVAITALLAESVTLETGATAAASLTPEARQFQAGEAGVGAGPAGSQGGDGEEARKEA